MKKAILYAVLTCFLLKGGGIAAQGEKAIIPAPSAPVKNDNKEGAVFTGYVDEVPEFPGGQSSLMRYLSSNLRYPQEAIDANIQGKVLVKFIVCTDGSLCDEEIVRGVEESLDKEVLRVVRTMPKWKPGKAEGKAVRTYFTLPVAFVLQEDTPEEASPEVELKESK